MSSLHPDHRWEPRILCRLWWPGDPPVTPGCGLHCSPALAAGGGDGSRALSSGEPGLWAPCTEPLVVTEHAVVCGGCTLHSATRRVARWDRVSTFTLLELFNKTMQRFQVSKLKLSWLVLRFQLCCRQRKDVCRPKAADGLERKNNWTIRECSGWKLSQQVLTRAVASASPHWWAAVGTAESAAVSDGSKGPFCGNSFPGRCSCWETFAKSISSPLPHPPAAKSALSCPCSLFLAPQTQAWCLRAPQGRSWACCGRPVPGAGALSQRSTGGCTPLWKKTLL